MSLDSDALLERRRLKRRVAFWRGAAILAVLGVTLWGLYRADPAGFLKVGDHVARVEITGVILENSYLDENLEQLAKDRHAKAVIVYVNSPGGSTFGGESLYLGLRRLSEAGKPVVAVIGTLGASAGYMVAVAADRVYARETSLTGSIGVLFQAAEFSKLMEKVGVTPLSVTSGPFKDEPSPFRPLSSAGRTMLQEMVGETHRWFVQLVAKRRGLATERVAKLADGRVYSGRVALDAGLIDELGGEIEARQWLADKHGVSRDLPVRDVPTSPPPQVWRDLGLRTLLKVFSPETLTLDGLVSVWHPDGSRIGR
jgi:protease IV